MQRRVPQLVKDILEEYSIQGKDQCVVLIPGIFDICKLKLDLEVEVTVSEWNKSRVPDAIVLNGCAILWIVAMEWPTQGVVKGFAKYR